jgi:AcrR family transcriptional regulator
MPKYINEENLFLEVVRSIGEVGIGKTTTKQIARSSGVNEVTLFRKYGSKLGLIEAAFQYILAASPLQGLRYSGDLEADLNQIVSAYQETSFLYGEVIPIILAEIPRDPELRELLEPFLTVVRSIMKIIQKYQQEGVLIIESGFSAVSALLGPVIIHRMLQRANPDFIVDEIEDSYYVQAFLEGRRQFNPR